MRLVDLALSPARKTSRFCFFPSEIAAVNRMFADFFAIFNLLRVSILLLRSGFSGTIWARK